MNIVPRSKIKLPHITYCFVCKECGWRSYMKIETPISQIGELVLRAVKYKRKCPKCGGELKKEKNIILT